MFSTRSQSESVASFTLPPSPNFPSPRKKSSPPTSAAPDRSWNWLKPLAFRYISSARPSCIRFAISLVPLSPGIVNDLLVTAFLGVRLRTYVIGTAVGIIPGSFVFASVGAGLGSLFDMTREGEVELSGVLTPEIVTALVGLAVLSLLPVAYKKYKSRGV